jgi:hypothetical protein
MWFAVPAGNSPAAATISHDVCGGEQRDRDDVAQDCSRMREIGAEPSPYGTPDAQLTRV